MVTDKTAALPFPLLQQPNFPKDKKVDFSTMSGSQPGNESSNTSDDKELTLPIVETDILSPQSNRIPLQDANSNCVSEATEFLTGAEPRDRVQAWQEEEYSDEELDQINAAMLAYGEVVSENHQGTIDRRTMRGTPAATTPPASARATAPASAQVQEDDEVTVVAAPVPAPDGTSNGGSNNNKPPASKDDRKRKRSEGSGHEEVEDDEVTVTGVVKARSEQEEGEDDEVIVTGVVPPRPPEPTEVLDLTGPDEGCKGMRGAGPAMETPSSSVGPFRLSRGINSCLNIGGHKKVVNAKDRNEFLRGWHLLQDESNKVEISCLPLEPAALKTKTAGVLPTSNGKVGHGALGAKRSKTIVAVPLGSNAGAAVRGAGQVMDGNGGSTVPTGLRGGGPPPAVPPRTSTTPPAGVPRPAATFWSNFSRQQQQRRRRGNLNRPLPLGTRMEPMGTGEEGPQRRVHHVPLAEQHPVRFRNNFQYCSDALEVFRLPSNIIQSLHLDDRRRAMLQQHEQCVKSIIVLLSIQYGTGQTTGIGPRRSSIRTMLTSANAATRTAGELARRFGMQVCEELDTSGVSWSELETYQVFMAINRLRLNMRREGIFGLAYLRSEGQMDPANTLGVCLEYFLVFDRFLPHRHFREYLDMSNAAHMLLTPAEQARVATNVAHHRDFAGIDLGGLQGAHIP